MCFCISRKTWSPGKDNKTEDENDKQRRNAVFQSNSELTTNIPVNLKTQEEENLIKTAIEQNDFMSRIISGDILKDVIEVMYKREIRAGEIIIRQGNTGSHMYVSIQGTFEIITPKLKYSFDDIRIFGELAILYDAKRLATIRAVTDAAVWVLDAPVYQKILAKYNFKEQDEKVNFLVKNDVLKDAEERVIKLVANSLRSEYFPSGKSIVKEGEKGNKFYIVRAGTVTVTKEETGILSTHGKGYWFGEKALLEETRRQATVIANPPLVECFTLSRKLFFELTEYLKVPPRNSTIKPNNQFENIELKDLQAVNTIGMGGFGRIELVRLKENKNQVFALKMMNKHGIVSDKRQQQALNEKLQMNCDSPFIVKMYKTFKDSRYIYYLLEYCPGGDLWTLLYRGQVNRRFKEKEGKFIIGCVLEALEYLHNKEIIYRDLKPENVLLTPSGYFKLTDFGYIKNLARFEKTFTFAGTVEYVAPEVAQKKTYDRTVDFWACGIFIFELLCGRTPFGTFDGNEQKIFRNILNGIEKQSFPGSIPPLAKNLILKLCKSDPTERLGESGGIRDIKNHDWFLGFNWMKLQKLQMNSPFKFHSRNYKGRQYQPVKELPPEETSGWDNDF